MSNLRARGVQTKVKHDILEAYIKYWGGIITNGLRPTYQQAVSGGWASRFILRFVYVDCFAYTGRYAPENGNPVVGSPIIGIREIERLSDFIRTELGLTPQTYCILIEKGRASYNQLLQTLEEEGYSDRVQETSDFFSLSQGEIAVVMGDYEDFVTQLIAFTHQDKYTWSFYFLDPYGPQGMSFQSVGRIASQHHTDVIINFPYYEVHKMLGPASSENPNPKHLNHMHYIDLMFNSPEWRQIAIDYLRNQAITGKEAEDTLISMYETALQRQDASITIKQIPLKLDLADRTAYHLFLTTHDPTGALAMNKILDSAAVKEFDYREVKRLLKPKMKLMFSEEDMLDAMPDRPEFPEADIAHVANEIYQRHRNSTVEFREILHGMANAPYYYEDIEAAVKHLKKSAKVSYEGGSIHNSTEIHFIK